VKPVDVTVPQVADRRGRHRVSAVVDGRRVWFESADVPLAAASEALGAALLVPALHAGRPLRLAGPVCDAWAANLGRLTDEFRRLWYPAAPRPLAVPGHVAAGFQPAESARHATHISRVPNPRPHPSTSPTALCFSGGVDAFHTLLTGGHRIDTLVYVVGYDVPHRDRHRAGAMTALLRDVAAETGCESAAIVTNLRRHPLVKATPWLRAFSGPLAAAGHLLGPAVGRMLVSSDGLGFEHPEVGARPSTDPLHGSATLAIEHVGHPIPRLAKITAIAGERLVQRHLRVCWRNRRSSRGQLNCGRCEKCIRTMLAIDAGGLLGKFAGFDHGRGLAAAIDALPEVDGVVELFYRDLLGHGLSSSAAAAVRRLLDRSAPATQVAVGFQPAESALHATHIPRVTNPRPHQAPPHGAAGFQPAESALHATPHRLLSPAAFAHVCNPLVGHRVGYVRPEGNVGDHLIEVAMIQLFAEYGIRWRLVSPADRRIAEGLDLLVFGGGGNMGTRYPGNHALRTEALATGLPVVILPQSFTSPEERSFATVFVRERGSLALRPDGILAPDLALGLATAEPPRPSHGLGVYLRRDQERGGRKPFFARDPVRLFRDPFAYLAFAARHRRIVTDRLHFAVAGLHAGRDVTLVANDYHKNRSMHETWLADLGCRFAATAAEAFGRRAA
jgi:hypothetical protein